MLNKQAIEIWDVTVPHSTVIAITIDLYITMDKLYQCRDM